MKNITLIIFLSLFAHFTASADVILIRGQLHGEKIDKVPLTVTLPYTNPEPSPLTTTTDKQGNFKFAVPMKGMELIKLAINDNNFIILIPDNNQTIELSLFAGNLSHMPVVQGSEHTQILYDLAKTNDYYEQRIDSIQDQFQEMTNTSVDEKRTRTLYEKYQAITKNYIGFLRKKLNDHAESPATLFFIDKLSMEDSFETYDKVACNLYSRYPGNAMVANLQQKVDAEKRMAIGNVAPEIELPTPEGKKVKLSSLRGKVVLIDFWAGWCAPCRKENPHLLELYKKYNDKGFEIYGVSLDRDRKVWTSAIQKDKLPWANVSDLKYWKSDAAKAYGVGAIPYTVLIDENGVIIARKLRGEALDEKLAEIFANR